jgi:hypothetical protein
MVGFLTFNRRKQNRHRKSPVNNLIPKLMDSHAITAA